MIRLLLLTMLLSGMLVAAVAQAAKTDDIRVLIDVSGSMVKTDPNNLRVPAMRMLNGLLPSGSKAGVWTFGRYVNMEVKWGVVNDRWRKLADAGATRIHSRGQFTNIESALNRASKDWKKADAKTRRNIILLTDGKVDISKDAEKNAQSRSRLLAKTIPQFLSKGIKVHAIALSAFADQEMLKRLAIGTAGSFEIAHSAKDLQRIFLHMFERAAKPDTIPLQDNRFTIDKSIREMTLLVFRKTDKAVQLIQPDDMRHTLKKHSANVRWRSDQGYDLITVSQPAAGQWSLQADMDKDNRVMIVTDLKLSVDDLPAYAIPDEDLSIKVELHDKDKKIAKQSFLKFVEFKLDHKVGGATESMPLVLKKSRDVRDKGIYLQQITHPLEEGMHEIVVSADARTFNRSKRFNVNVQWPIEVETENTARPGEYRLRVSAREEYIKPESLRLEVKLEQPNGDSQPVAMAIDKLQWIGELDATGENGLHKLQITLHAVTRVGETIRHTLTERSVLGVKFAPAEVITSPANEAIDYGAEGDQDASQDDGSSLVQSLVIIGISNLILILGAAGIFFYLRKKKQNVEINLMEETVVDEEGRDD